ncbi:hypothetical protein LTR84_007090 [Exophiala bonariae]|uniref:Uncharacterized protein n=1 Tax=Exophiala bonariae TaxID=1690606 RepID=A0AAV9MZY0_9EURO|nr:hypothetical protein LTR84_007090 [Exophiala bonariae]
MSMAIFAACTACDHWRCTNCIYTCLPKSTPDQNFERNSRSVPRPEENLLPSHQTTPVPLSEESREPTARIQNRAITDLDLFARQFSNPAFIARDHTPTNFIANGNMAPVPESSASRVTQARPHLGSTRSHDKLSVSVTPSLEPSPELPHDSMEHLIPLFGQALLEKSGACVWAGFAIEKYSTDFLRATMGAILGTYSDELQSSTLLTPMNEIVEAADFIRKVQLKIIHFIHKKLTSFPLASTSTTLPFHEFSEHESLSDTFDLLYQSDPHEIVDAVRDDHTSGNEMETEYSVMHDSIHSFQDLISCEPFQNLVQSFRRALYYDERLANSSIASRIQDFSRSEPHHALQHDQVISRENQELYSAHFHMDWDILQYLDNEFGNRRQRIGDIIVLTGSALYAHATTCSEYLRVNWPRSGMRLLSALQKAVFEGLTPAGKIEHVDHHDLAQDDSSISVKISERYSEAPASIVQVHCLATKQMLVEIAQQLSWIGAALNTPPYEHRVAYCKAAFQTLPPEGAFPFVNFALKFEFDVLHSSEEICWLSHFRGATIARDYPIPARQDEMGLEVSLEVMAAIVGASHVVEYQGGVVLKGFSSMLLPIRCNGDIVQWHLVGNPDFEHRLSYHKALTLCKSRAYLNEVNLETARQARAIVGWHPKVHSLLGSDEAKYENISYSKAQGIQSSLKFTGAGLGFQQIGLAELNFALGPKADKCHIERAGPYNRIVSMAERTPIVLYDTIERRAWLVPTSEVILHLAHSRNQDEPFEINGQPVKLFSAEPSGLCAKEALLRGASVDLSDCETYTFRDLVRRLWSILEFLLDQNVTEDQAAGMTVPTNLKETIQGFEFKAVVEEQSPLRRKQWTIDKTTSGGWPALIRESDALVLFASGLGDIIKPFSEDEQPICTVWRTVPKFKDYLATSVKVLKQLYDVAGSSLDRTYLTTSHLQWHRGDSFLFEPCRTLASHPV